MQRYLLLCAMGSRHSQILRWEKKLVQHLQLNWKYLSKLQSTLLIQVFNLLKIYLTPIQAHVSKVTQKGLSSAGIVNNKGLEVI